MFDAARFSAHSEAVLAVLRTHKESQRAGLEVWYADAAALLDEILRVNEDAPVEQWDVDHLVELVSHAAPEVGCVPSLFCLS